MKIKTSLTSKERLAKYSLLAAGIIGTDQLNAQNIIYTDEVPDFSGVANSEYFLDLNNDGIDDFRIYQNQSVYSYYGSTYSYNSLLIQPLVNNNGVLGSGATNFAYPYALNTGAPISNGAGSFNTNGFTTGVNALNSFNGNYGNWVGVTDKYLGFKFDIAGQTHYGWARLNANSAGDVWSVKDYAYDATADAPINAGDRQASATAAIIGTDVNDNSNGTDLHATFVASADETTVTEYRVIAVESASAATFDLTAANALTATAYISVTPDGSANYTSLFTAGTTDSDGNAIIIDVAYNIFVLAIANESGSNTNPELNTNINALVSSAATITLNTTADAAQTIVGSDIGDNAATETDLQVNFAAATNESSVQTYNVIAVKDTEAAAFTLAAAQGLPATSSLSVTPTGGPYSVTFTAGKKDSDGNAIVNGQAYSIFILSTADGSNANIDSLAQSSSTVTLNANTSAGITVNELSQIALTFDQSSIYIVTPTELLANQISFTFVNVQGQILQQSEIRDNSTTLSKKGLSSGMYFVNLIDKSGHSQSIKVMI